MSRSSLTEFALANPLYVWVIVLTCLVGGLAGGQRIAQLEDPPYPIKIAYVFTEYPGASTLDVEQEITEVLERSIQELPWIENIVSRSLPGRSEIEIELNHSVSASDTGQIWDELRRRVAEAAMRLPAGAHPPWVEDDFSDVYGLLYGFTVPDGYDIATIRDAARLLETEIKRVEHVAKARVEGVPEEQVQIDFDYAQLRQLGVPFHRIVEAINSASGLFPASMMESGDQRIRIDIPLERSEAVLEELLIALPGETSMIRLGDVARVSREETNLPSLIVRHEGQRIFALGIAINETQNVVRVGKVVEARLLELQQLLPIGIEMIPLFEQHRLVDRSIGQFLLNLTASITTVIAALCLFMGWRAGVMVGAVLLLTVTGTIGVMATSGIELQRISLGAMMIAMGMLVDNAIVVTEGMITRIKQGLSPRESAIAAVATTRFPLLAADGYRDCCLCPHWPVERLNGSVSRIVVHGLRHIAAVELDSGDYAGALHRDGTADLRAGGCAREPPLRWAGFRGISQTHGMGYCPTRLDHACPAGRHVVEHCGLHTIEARVFSGNQHAAVLCGSVPNPGHRYPRQRSRGGSRAQAVGQSWGRDRSLNLGGARPHSLHHDSAARATRPRLCAIGSECR
jgi:hypothetical protein